LGFARRIKLSREPKIVFDLNFKKKGVFRSGRNITLHYLLDCRLYDVSKEAIEVTVIRQRRRLGRRPLI
jgi:hypothetical protein